MVCQYSHLCFRENLRFFCRKRRHFWQALWDSRHVREGIARDYYRGCSTHGSMIALEESRLWHLIVCDRGVSLLAHQVNVLLRLNAQDKRAFSYRVFVTSLIIVVLIIFLPFCHWLLVYDRIDIEELEESLRDPILDCLDSIIDGIFNKTWCMIFLLVNNCCASLIHNLFLLFYRKEIVLLISMTEAEEYSCDWASLREFIQCLVLQELFNISLVLNFRRIIACKTSS